MRKWTAATCRRCRAAVCDEGCQYRHFADEYAFLQAVKAAKEAYTLISPQDDVELFLEAQASRDHKVVPVVKLENLRPDVRRYLVQRGLTFAILDEPGEEVHEVLPAGIFPQVARESIEDVLVRHGLPATLLHAELDYGTGMLEGRVSEDILWDPTQPESIFREPVPRFTKRVNGKDVELPGWSPFPLDGAEEENRQREGRFYALTAFLQEMFACIEEGFGPALIQTRRGWRFRHFRNHKALVDRNTWQFFPTGKVEVESHSTGGVTAFWKPDPVPFIQALWAYVWWRRRAWLERQDKPADVHVHGPACLLEAKPVWLSEPHLAAIREVFRRLLRELRLPEDTLKIREERKVTSWLQRLQARLEYLEDLEERSLRRLRHLQETEQLTQEKVQAAITHLDRLAAEKNRIQSELEFVVLHEAQEFYGKDFLGYDLLAVEHTPEELEELRAEVEALA